MTPAGDRGEGGASLREPRTTQHGGSVSPALSADAAASGALFKIFHDRIHRYIVSLVHDPPEAEDLTQDTFLRAYRARESLRDPGAARGWLYRIATHVCLDRLRQRVPRVSLDSEEGAARAEPAVAEPSPLEIAERAETSACVQRCLDLLSDSYRAVILLHEGHSLTAPEIAELLDVSLDTVKIRLHRARKKLREIMDFGCAISSGQDGVPCCEQKV
jgi:RNA polymerase sigma-70 factor (ECF subfamily)